MKSIVIFVVLAIIMAIIAAIINKIISNKESDNTEGAQQGNTPAGASDSTDDNKTPISSEIVYWKQNGKDKSHSYTLTKEGKSKSEWWSKKGYGTNVAWPTKGESSFILGLTVSNATDKNLSFGISSRTNKLWIKDEANKVIINKGFLRDVYGITITGITIKPYNTKFFFTEPVNISVLKKRNIAEYGIYVGKSVDNSQKIGSIILEGSKKANI